ncbi:expressed unknown protein [Ectocarpus siliculosus]|uniref:YHYH domain-containing protein n=1 Tax=Ectocarpus siliculosus TaxID=2880 RepID=D8LCJ4_ECTSI|nr:expressed unknown protein [Ectocarpus siliculosus]|eukprot:CBN79507.1 expressed unknown protein [Ectocarpus siliculosus]
MCFSVTVHRAQGPTVDRTCLDLTVDPFAHGHLYVGLSRVRRRRLHTMVRWAVTDTGCPNHVSWDINPNFAGVSDRNASILAYPMMSADNGTKDLSSASGTICMMRNGVSHVQDYFDTAFYLEADSFDPCGGHATPNGFYHYHGTAVACRNRRRRSRASTRRCWAGHTCAEPKGRTTRSASTCAPATRPSSTRMSTPTATTRDRYNHNRCSEKVDACGDDPVAGYTADLVPAETASLDEMYDALLIEGLDTDIIGSNFTVNCTLYLGSGGDGTEDEDDATSATSTTADEGAVTVDDATHDAATAVLDDDVPTTSDVATMIDATDAVDDDDTDPDASEAAEDGSSESPLGAASHTPGTVFMGVITAAAAAMFVGA